MSAAPWSVKGIDPKAREVAKDLARRSGMTLGEWLNSMIMEDEGDEPYVPLRRPHASESFDRRGRSRRLDDAYDTTNDTLFRVSASVDAIAARLEAAERRSTVAIQGVDQAVAGLVRRMDEQGAMSGAQSRRIDDISEELKEGHRRLRQFERDVGPQTHETFGKVEKGLGALASRLYDIEERQRSSVNDLRQRMDAVEKTAGPGVGSDLLAQVSARLDQAQNRTTEALRGLERSFAGLDQRMRAAEGRMEPEGSRETARFEKLAETLARQVDANRAEMMRRLDTAETEGRMDRIERAILAMGETVKASEQSSAQGIEAMGREVLRIAQNLNGRMQKVEDQAVSHAERLTDAVTHKIDAATTAINASLGEKLDRDMSRYAQAMDQRLTRADDQHALALERLGGEITRISDRLADRIAQSERKSAQALEDIGRRLTDSSERAEQRYDRASGELAERMRLSEERTAQLLAEARDAIAERNPREAAARSEPVDAAAADLNQPDWRASHFNDGFGEVASDGGWSNDPLVAGPALAPFPGQTSEPAESRPVAAQAFAGPSISAPDDFAVSPEPVVPNFAPMFAEPTLAPEPTPAPVAQTQAAVSSPMFGGFGGADVGDALEATESAIRPQVPTGGPFSGAQPDYSTHHGFGVGQDEFSAETDFVDPRSLRAGLAAGAANARASSTRNAIDAARAAMTVAGHETESHAAFGLGGKRGGKSKLQERLDKQANRGGGTAKKALLASITSMAVVGGAFATGRILVGPDFASEGLSAVNQVLGLDAPAAPVGSGADPLAAVALTTPTDAGAAGGAEAQTLYDQATQALDAGQPGAAQTLIRAASLGLPAAQVRLADLYATGEGGVTANMTEARLWARRAAEAGDAKGMHAFGMYLYDGVGGARNRPEALNWLLKAANKGLVDSQYNVAKIYENGDEGIAPNPTEALKWFMIAARTGDEMAPADVERLTPTVPSAARRTARAAADAFQTQPLA